MELTFQIVAFLLGPLAALIPIVIWELRIKPKHDRGNVARTLWREIWFNKDQLDSIAELDQGSPHIALPTGVRLSTVAFDALAAQVATLDSDLGTRVIFLYNAISRFNSLAADHDEMATTVTISALDTAGRARHSIHLNMLVSAIRDQSRMIRVVAGEVLGELARLAPGETGRQRALPPSQ